MKLFGVGNRRASRSIRLNEVEKLSTLSRKFSTKSPKEIDELVQKTIKSLGKSLLEDHVQSIFVGFVADLCNNDNQRALENVFKQQVVSDKNAKKTFVSAMIADQGQRALKFVMVNPDLLFEPVREGKPAYEFFNDKAFGILLSSGSINEDFLIRHLRLNG